MHQNEKRENRIKEKSENQSFRKNIRNINNF